MAHTNIKLLLGVPFHPVDMAGAIKVCADTIEAGDPGYVATANLDFIAQAYDDDDLRNILFFANCVVCDGMPLIWFSRLVKAPLPERVAGSDMVFELFALANEKHYRIYFLGSDEATLRLAKERIEKRYPNLEICGWHSPPFAPLHEWKNEEIIAEMQEKKPHLLMMAVGCPKQERWIYEHYKETGIPLSIGIGASLDFIAGKQQRAPAWMQKTGLEWLWRMGTNPKRLVKRYIKDFYFLIKLGLLQWRLTHYKRQAREEAAQTTHKDVAFRSKKAQVLAWQGTVDAARASGLPMDNQPTKPVLIDTSEVTFMDSTGLGQLVQQARYCREAGMAFGLLEPSKCVRLLIDGLHMETQLPIYASVQAFHKETQAPFATRSQVAHKCQTLSLSGYIDVNSVERVEQTLMATLKELPEGSTLKLDFSEVRFIDSSGIGRLLAVRKKADTAKVTFGLINVSGTPLKVLQLVCLDKILVYDH